MKAKEGGQKAVMRYFELSWAFKVKMNAQDA